VYGKPVAVITGGKERGITVDEEYLRRSLIEPGADVVAGYPNIMPSEKDNLTKDDVEAVIEFLKTLG
jgi:cytochrome c oxidase subunit 2